MISNRRQILPFFVVLVMVVSVFAFMPAKAEASLTATLEGRNGNYSFASVNGSANYTVTIVNDGDFDFTEVDISASFADPTWLSKNVTFTNSTDTTNATMSLGSLVQGAIIQVQVSATVGDGAKVDFAEVPMFLDIEAEGISLGLDAIVCVTNWIAYVPGEPAIETYAVGDEHPYQVVVENIAVSKNLVDDTTTPMAISDVITVQYTGSGWWVDSNDTGWDPMLGGILHGINASASHTWNITINLTGDVKAGSHVIDLQASSTDPDDPWGGMPYIQPYGMTDIEVVAAESYGVSVSGGGAQNVDLSEGSAVVTWESVIRNLGNTKDTFSITWDTSDVPAGWTLSNQPDTTGEVNWKQTSSIPISLTVPADAMADATATFSMTATSTKSGGEHASQSFIATVDQHYGVSLSVVDSDSQLKEPGGTADFIFNVTNTGNGADTFGIVVEGPAIWAPMASQSSITVPAVSTGQFIVSVTVPEDKDAGADSGGIAVTVTSSDGESTASRNVSVETAQVYNLSIAHASGYDGTVTVAQETQLQLKLNITNNGNGLDTVSLVLKDEPGWATLGATEIEIARGQTVSIVVTLSPDAAALSGRDYTFWVVATSAGGSEITSPDLSAEIEVKETEGEEVVTEEIEEEDEGGLPGFGAFVSLLALTFVVLSRRRD